MGINQDVYVGKQHLREPSPTPEPRLVVLGIERPE